MFALDIETIGLPVRLGYNKYPDPSSSRNYDSCRVVSIGMIFDDEEYYYIVKPDNFVINNSHFHGITQEIAEQEGLHIKDIFTPELLDKIRQYDSIVGHNISFDWYILRSELIRYNIPDVLKDKKLICTMNLGKKYFQLKKVPKLSELYELCFRTVNGGAHNAIGDTRASLECYNMMNSKGKL